MVHVGVRFAYRRGVSMAPAAAVGVVLYGHFGPKTLWTHGWSKLPIDSATQNTICNYSVHFPIQIINTVTLAFC